jgi:hypothetical protein
MEQSASRKAEEAGAAYVPTHSLIYATGFTHTHARARAHICAVHTLMMQADVDAHILLQVVYSKIQILFVVLLPRAQILPLSGASTQLALLNGVSGGRHSAKSIRWVVV